jgi:flagellar biosynthesis chaperone FliJ
MIEDLDNAIEQATNKKEQLEKNFENAFNTWTSRKQRNIYIPK